MHRKGPDHRDARLKCQSCEGQQQLCKYHGQNTGRKERKWRQIWKYVYIQINGYRWDKTPTQTHTKAAPDSPDHNT